MPVGGLPHLDPHGGTSLWTTAGKTASQAAAADHPILMRIPLDFVSDVGRKRFGFSHEELDNAAAYYEGEFKISMRHGHGVLHNTETGARYVGNFQADRPHGHGDQTWPDGSRYVGSWANGRKHGTGTFKSAESLRYEGQWQNGFKDGYGVQEYANGDTYKGWWLNGVCHGMGSYYFADGSVYEGIWSHGRYDGIGTFHGNDNTRERHVYSMGSLVKREVLSNAIPATYGSRSMSVGSKILFGQIRDEVHKPTIIREAQASKYLIRRETAGFDLSAPPLKPKTAPAVQGSRCLGALDPEGLPGCHRPVTARGPYPAHGSL